MQEEEIRSSWKPHTLYQPQLDLAEAMLKTTPGLYSSVPIEQPLGFQEPLKGTECSGGPCIKGTWAPPPPIYVPGPFQDAGCMYSYGGGVFLST